ncbi:MAG: hypothetical protein WBA67_01185 [Jannaschia sp.]
MTACFDVPFLGITCLGDLTVRLAGFEVDLTHPSVIATFVIGSVLGIFIFRSPV